MRLSRVLARSRPPLIILSCLQLQPRFIALSKRIAIWSEASELKILTNVDGTASFLVLALAEGPYGCFYCRERRLPTDKQCGILLLKRWSASCLSRLSPCLLAALPRKLHFSLDRNQYKVYASQARPQPRRLSSFFPPSRWFISTWIMTSLGEAGAIAIESESLVFGEKCQCFQFMGLRFSSPTAI